MRALRINDLIEFSQQLSLKFLLKKGQWLREVEGLAQGHRTSEVGANLYPFLSELRVCPQFEGM